jgi:DNA helicase II / ATP-dependent DNA helicase PcrA
MPQALRPDEWRPVDVPELEPAVEEAVRASFNAVVVAGPGAGKTELLAQRACYLLQTDLCPAPRRILAISFKRDAARNLTERVAKRSDHELVRRFDSMTFDAFAKRLVDRFSRALPPRWRPSEDYKIDTPR